MKIWAITWRYYDKSGFGIVGLYAKEEAAKDRLALLTEHGCMDKVFELFALNMANVDVEE
jgi:hypothetical protein